MKLSVITCTYNPDADNLSRVFKALDQQSLPKDRWDYVVIDNGGDRPLRDSLDLRWHPQGRIAAEPEKGLTRARLRGIVETHGDVLVFVDDDNLLDPEYLETALDLLARYPFVGVLGGTGKGEFSTLVEPWVRPFLAVMAVNDEPEDCPHEIQYALTRKIGPWFPTGAGMIVRRIIAESYRQAVLSDPRRLGLDRTGAQSLAGGGDTDLTFTCIDEGMACGVSSRLKFTHIIPAWRLSAAYLEKLLYSSNYGLARLLIAHGWKKTTQPESVSAWVRLRWFLARLMDRSPAGQCWMAQHRGYIDGLAGAPHDRKYL
jgi:glycosyltransferase involved in cell wall biosynthesis